ncbi:RHS repeat-associated core domain-containing protein [Vibrio atlanticus]|uniref:RHS repeat-associated core domain-containing protein n=1 Tax=Vibrio atlanticus TaxID=693153 RepID=UPI00354CE4B6
MNKNYGSSGVNQRYIDLSKRTFIKYSTSLAALSPFIYFTPRFLLAGEAFKSKFESSGLIVPVKFSQSRLGFNGEREISDIGSGLYHLGNGFRIYSSGLTRFHSADVLSPFGEGGSNSYSYCFGDPVNLRDPSGKFAISSLIIGAIVGAILGAGISATAEGIRAIVTDTHFEWEQVGIGAALGFISGGFGAAATGAKTSVQVGLAIADASVSSAVSFGLELATGSSAKDAALNAGIGAVIGLVTFGAGRGIGVARSRRALMATRRQAMEMVELRHWSPLEDLTTITRQRSPGYQRTAAIYRSADDYVYSHGGIGLTMTPDGFKTAGRLAEYLPEGARSVQRFNLQTCFGATGGSMFSQGQALANHLNTRVVAWPGNYVRNLPATSGRVFRPQAPALARVTNSFNTAAGNLNKLVIYGRNPFWL